MRHWLNVTFDRFDRRSSLKTIAAGTFVSTRPPTRRNEPMMGFNGYLVGGLEHFFHILGIIAPTDEVIFFQRGWYTTNQYTIHR